MKKIIIKRLNCKNFQIFCTLISRPGLHPNYARKYFSSLIQIVDNKVVQAYNQAEGVLSICLALMTVFYLYKLFYINKNKCSLSLNLHTSGAIWASQNKNTSQFKTNKIIFPPEQIIKRIIIIFNHSILTEKLINE